jgi:hypothetical protein
MSFFRPNRESLANSEEKATAHDIEASEADSFATLVLAAIEGGFPLVTCRP